MGWKLASVAHFCRSTAPRALVLMHLCALYAVCHGSHQISPAWALSSRTILAVKKRSLMTHPIWKLIPFHVGACKGSKILLNPLINFQKNYTKPKNSCTYYIVVGFGHSLRLLTLASLICSPSGVMSNPRKVVVLHRKLHFFSLQ